MVNPYESPRAADVPIVEPPRPRADFWTRLRGYGVRGGLATVAAFFALGMGLAAMGPFFSRPPPLLEPALMAAVIALFTGSILSLLALLVGAVGAGFRR